MKTELNEIKIEELFSASNIDKAKKAINIVLKVQDKLTVLGEKEESNALKIKKVGTTLTVAILQKVQGGKFPTDFTSEDWEEILEQVFEYGVEADGTIYSAYVFMLYAWFIDTSVEKMSGRLSVAKQVAITSLSDEIKTKTEQLKNNEISEVEYIDDCLWICLEAMIKLISGTIDTALGFDREQVAEAAMILAFEYGRFVLYKREDALLTKYLENQKILDVELAMRYEEYCKQLEQEANVFNECIETAFTSDIRSALKNSAQLALAAGVDESEVLKTVQDVDDYFS